MEKSHTQLSASFGTCGLDTVTSTTEGPRFFTHRDEPQNREGDKPVRISTSTKKLKIEEHKNASYEVWIGTEYSTHKKSCRSHSTASLVLGIPAVSQGGSPVG